TACATTAASLIRRLRRYGAEGAPPLGVSCSGRPPAAIEKISRRDVMTTRRSVLKTMAGAGAAVSLSAYSPLRAQSKYPDKPVKMIVPFPPGGPIDTMARMTGQELGGRLGQQVVVENRPGGGSTIGTKDVAAAAPDGYTLMFGSSGSLAVAPALYS